MNELLKGLTKEQKEKARGAKTVEELLALAKEEGIELTDEQLEAVNGGCGVKRQFVCPQCGSSRVEYSVDIFANNSRGTIYCKCLDCGLSFEEDI